MLRRLFLAISLLAIAAPAVADGVVDKLMTSADKVRLRDYVKTREAALAEARGGDATDVAALDALLSKQPQSFAGFDLTGNWRCRTIKAGGLSKLIIYGWFKCRVTDDGSGWMLEKFTGSQRTKGRFYDDGDKRLIYLGSFSVNSDKPKPYASGPETDQVGYAFRSGSNGWRIEFPAPYYESKLDILELQR